MSENNSQSNDSQTNSNSSDNQTNSNSNNVNWSNLGKSVTDNLRNLWHMGKKRHLALRSRKGNTYFQLPFNILGVVFLLLVVTRLVWLAVIAALIAAFVFKVQFVIITDGVVKRTFNQANPPAETTPDTSADTSGEDANNS
jgi:Flp pilus assembly protein TadB